MSAKPFILRSEVKKPSAEDLARRETIISELTDADIERIGGATNTYPDIYPSDWHPDRGADMGTRKDGGTTPIDVPG